MKIMQAPLTVAVDITSQCNLRCKYCGHFATAADVPDDLDTQEWLEFFKELDQCGVFFLNLSGGEPFIRPDLKKIIEGIISSRMRFSILTNGTLVDEEMVKFIACCGRCNSVQISLDSSTSANHDIMRGQGSFEKSLSGIQLFKKYKVPISVRVTIHKKNYRDLPDIARLLLDDLQLSTFSTNYADLSGFCKWNAEETKLSIDERSYVMQSLLKLNKIYNNRITAYAGPLAEARTWLNMEEARRQKISRLPNRGYLTGCGTLSKNIAVRADGVIVPCISLSHIELGRINKDSIKAIWQNNPELKKLRERCLIPLSSFEYCRSCEYINYCSGNCPALAYSFTGKVNYPAPNACLKHFLESGGKLPPVKSLADTGGIGAYCST